MMHPTIPSLIHIDKAVNTALRDDSITCNKLSILQCIPRVSGYVDSVYAKEAEQHPGVRLVADAVLS